MKTTVEKLEGTTVKLTVTLSAEEVDAGIDEAYKRLAKKVRVPGFRPGKAPKPVVDNYLGREYVLGEATESLVNDSYPKALDAEGLRPIASPDIPELEPVEAGTEYTYEAEVELRPEYTISGTEGLEVTLPPRETTEEELNAQIEMLRERFATLEPVEDRGVEADDFVLVSFTGYVDGEPYEGNEVDKYLYEMNRGLMPSQFDEGLLGLKPGEEISIEFTIPDTSSNPEFVGKTARFDVTVHEIKEKRLPALDDEFAGNVGGFDSFEEMRADLKARLDVQKALGHDRLKERATREAIAERLEGDAPESMIITRVESMMREFLQQLEERGMSVPDYLEATGVDMDRIEADMRAQAAQGIREDLALEALFRHLGMEVTDEDLAAELATVTEATGQTPEEARKRWEELGLLPVAIEQVQHRKAVEWLMENVPVVEKEPEPETATRPAADAEPEDAPEDAETETEE